jgi:DivIVA domain-containing protein
VEDEPRAAPSKQQTGEQPLAKAEIRPARGRTFLPELTGVQFSSSRRGYDRGEVDEYVERVSRIVVELEAMRSPDAVIERALADVGEETSSILRRARKAAEEIIAEATEHASARASQAEAQASQLREDADRYGARVRAEAEEVLTEARAQAQQTAELAAADAKRRREEADRYQAQVAAHIEQLAVERHRLIDDLRQLADQFHRTADRALEQIPASDAFQDRAEAADGGVRNLGEARVSSQRELRDGDLGAGRRRRPADPQPS